MNNTQTPSIPSNSDERLLAALAHIGGIFISFLIPLLLWVVKKDESEYISDHAKEALNFQISIFIGYCIAGILVIVLIGIPLLIAIWLFSVVFSIIAGIKAANGETYRYPLTIRLIS